jgi:hypothetical protein
MRGGFLNKKNIIIVTVLIILCILFVPNTANHIRYSIAKITGNVNMYSEVDGIGIVKIENDFPEADQILLKGDSIKISSKQLKGAEEVYVYGIIANSFEKPKLIINGIENLYSARMNNQQILSVWSPAYILRGFAFKLDVDKLKPKNTLIIRCNGKEEKYFLYMGD